METAAPDLSVMSDTDASSVYTQNTSILSMAAIDEDAQSDITSMSGDSGVWDVESSTNSVTSSIFNYEEAHGRTYHAFHRGQYLFPNDSSEIARIEVKYHAVRLSINDTIFFAPIEDPQNILDVGTGTGIWCVDVADAYPNATVKGIDLSPIQPSYIPSNCSFEITDAEDEWTFSQPFDLIHTRIMIDFTLKSWPTFFNKAYEHLSPGGWVECQEFDFHRQSDDDTIKPDSRVKYWEEQVTVAFNRIGMTGCCNPELTMQQMRNAGFTNIQCRNFKLPIGPWAKDPRLKEAGTFGLVNLLEGMQGLSAKLFTDVPGWDAEQLDALITECRQELRQKRVHGYYPIYVITGQKAGAV